MRNGDIGPGVAFGFNAILDDIERCHFRARRPGVVHHDFAGIGGRAEQDGCSKSG